MNTASLNNQCQANPQVQQTVCGHKQCKCTPDETNNIDANRVKKFESAPLDDREKTVQELRRQQKANRRSFRHQSNRTERLDPRYIEEQQAHRSMLLGRLKASYAERNDTPFWALMVWMLSTLALSPFARIALASGFALFIAIAWAIFHRVRRV
jgi:hypothetical protein